MRWLVFLSKVAMLCNLAFIACLIFMFSHYKLSSQSLQSTIIVLGFFLSFVFNIIVTIVEVVLVLFRKPSPQNMWLRAFNFIAFAIQITFFLFINHDQYL